MQTTNHSGLQCLQHPREEITNFCVNVQCLKPLCPDCVQIHTKLHQKQEIESWKHCVTRTAGKAKTTLDELRALFEAQRQWRGSKSVEVVQSENLKRLAALRERYHKLVDEVFNSHDNAVRMTVRQQYRVDQPDTSKLRMAIEELEKVLMKLAHTSSAVPALKKALLLDHRALLEYFAHLRQPRGPLPQDCFFLELPAALPSLRTALERAITLEQLPPPTPTGLSQQGSPYQERRYSNQVSVGESVDALEPLRVSVADYFRADCKNKLLHFFVPCSFELKVLRVEEAERGAWRSLEFQAKRQLPCYFKSIATPSGQLYLTGGSQQERRCREIYRYNFQRNSLDFVCNMINQRSSHSVCYLEGKIYLIGGFSGPDGEVTRECQAFDLQTLTCARIAPLNTPSANSAAASFSGQYIFKFGGIFNKAEGNSLIEMYSLRQNRWTVVSIQTPRSLTGLQLLSFSAAVQINERDVLVFGGYDNSELQRPQRVCYALSVSAERNSVAVRNYNTNPLPYAEGFWNNNPLVQGKAVYALQNITDQQDELTALADERRLIVFNGDRWL